MKEDTKDLLEKLRHVKWFSSVGLKDSIEAEVLNSWKKAFTSGTSRRWDDFTDERSDDYRVELRAASLERFEQWNDTVRLVRPHVQSLVEEKVKESFETITYPENFVNTVRWDILFALMEQEFSDVLPLGFYTKLAEWYLRGHFPCGWLGDYPDGKLIVY